MISHETELKILCLVGSIADMQKSIAALKVIQPGTYLHERRSFALALEWQEAQKMAVMVEDAMTESLIAWGCLAIEEPD